MSFTALSIIHYPPKTTLIDADLISYYIGSSNLFHLIMTSI